MVKRYPSAVGKFLKGSLALAVGLGVYFWMRARADDERQEKLERELADLDIKDLLNKELRAFRSSCVNTASTRSPELAESYCICLAGALRDHFDTASITAYSVEDYRRQFSSRFAAASPGQSVRASCWAQVQPRPLAQPAATAVKTAKPKSAPKLLAPPVERDDRQK